MTVILNWLGELWEYIVSHKWAFDIVRADFLYVLIIVLYSFLHLIYPGFNLVPWGLFWRIFVVANIVLLFKALLDYMDPEN